MSRAYPPLRIVPLLAVAGLAACDFGEVGFFDLPAPDEVPVTLTFLAEDAETAAALGWENGGLPAGAVRLNALDPETPFEFEGEASSAGVLELGELPVGEYAVEVTRMLDEEERAALDGGADGPLGFLHRGEFRVSGAFGDVEIRVPAARTRALVISEVKQVMDPVGANGRYDSSLYWEIYNNSDTTIHLDGKVIGIGFDLWGDAQTRPCTMFDHLRVDPSGIWSLMFEQFPGSGTDHPLLPGETAIIALEAIDHSAISESPYPLDLSDADFESPGPAGVDNPAVPNMIDIGLMQHPNGRGMYREGGLFFISEPVATDELPRDQEPDTGREYVRIPADDVLDVVTRHHDQGWRGTTSPPCPAVVHSSFDQRWVHRLAFRDDAGLSLQRRPLLTLPDGRVVLQHTRSSYADFVPAPVSPGAVPEPE